MPFLLAARLYGVKILTVITAAVLGFEVADVLGLLKSHNFASACGALAATAAMALNLWNNRRDRRLHDLADLATNNSITIRGQGITIHAQGHTIHAQGHTIQALEETVDSLEETVDREATARLVIEAELAQVSEQLLQQGNILAVYSGQREPIRPLAPATAADVLILDDADWVVDSLSRLLRRYGFRVETALTVAAAWSLVEQRNRIGRRYDFAVFDLNLPDGTVDDVLHLACEIHPGTDVIVATGITDEETLERAKRCTSRVMVKPVDLYELLAAMGCDVERK